MLQHTKRQVKLFEMHCSTMLIIALCVNFLKWNFVGRRTRVSMLKNEGLLGGGCMFTCSLWKFTVVPLFPKNKERCSPKFTFTEFPCSQKFRSMLPWSPKIFQITKSIPDTPRQNASFSSLMTEKERNCNTLPIFCRRKGLFPSYTLKKFFQWSGNQCSRVPDYNSTVPLFPKSKWSCSLVP